jgi:hypothetical protein
MPRAPRGAATKRRASASSGVRAGTGRPLSQEIDMSIRSLWRRGALAGALALGLGGAAAAGETFQSETRVELRTKTGAVEALTLEDLAVGEVKALRADSGTPVVASRDADGYLLEIGAEEFRLPDVDAHRIAHDAELAAPGAAHAQDGVQERIVVERHADGDGIVHGERRIVIVRGHATADGDAARAHAHALAQDTPSLRDPGHEDKRILVTRRVRHVKTARGGTQ